MDDVPRYKGSTQSKVMPSIRTGGILPGGLGPYAVTLHLLTQVELFSINTRLFKSYRMRFPSTVLRIVQFEVETRTSYVRPLIQFHPIYFPPSRSINKLDRSHRTVAKCGDAKEIKDSSWQLQNLSLFIGNCRANHLMRDFQGFWKPSKATLDWGANLGSRIPPSPI